MSTQKSLLDCYSTTPIFLSSATHQYSFVTASYTVVTPSPWQNLATDRHVNTCQSTKPLMWLLELQSVSWGHENSTSHTIAARRWLSKQRNDYSWLCMNLKHFFNRCPFGTSLSAAMQKGYENITKYESHLLLGTSPQQQPPSSWYML